MACELGESYQSPQWGGESPVSGQYKELGERRVKRVGSLACRNNKDEVSDEVKIHNTIEVAKCTSLELWLRLSDVLCTWTLRVERLERSVVVFRLYMRYTVIENEF